MQSSFKIYSCESSTTASASAISETFSPLMSKTKKAVWKSNVCLTLIRTLSSWLILSTKSSRRCMSTQGLKARWTCLCVISYRMNTAASTSWRSMTLRRMDSQWALKTGLNRQSIWSEWNSSRRKLCLTRPAVPISSVKSHIGNSRQALRRAAANMTCGMMIYIRNSLT